MKKILTIVFLLLASVAVCQADYPVGSQLNIDGSTLGWDDTAKKWRPIAVDANGNIKTDSGESTQEISVDTSNIESYLKEVDGEDTVTITDLINGIGTDTKDIKNDLEVDNKTITELVNGIGTDTKNIDNKLVATYTTQFDTYQQTVGEMLKNISQYFGEDNGSINKNIFNIFNDLVMQYSSITSIEQGVGALVKTSQPDVLKTVRLNLSANTATQISPISVTGNRSRVFVELRAIDPDTEFYIGFDNTVTDSTGRPVKGRILLNMPSYQALYVYHTNSSAIDVQQTEGWR